MSLLALVVTVGLAASGIVAVIRAVVPQEWLLFKPFSCDLCMSWWSSLAVVLALALADTVTLPNAAVAALGGVGVSLLSVKASNRLSA